MAQGSRAEGQPIEISYANLTKERGLSCFWALVGRKGTRRGKGYVKGEKKGGKGRVRDRICGTMCEK